MISKASLQIFRFLRVLGMTLLLGIGILLFISVILRFFGISSAWIQELIQLSNVWMVFLGTAVLVYDKSHIALDLFTEGNLKVGIRKIQEVFISICIVLISLVFIIGGYYLFIEGQSQVSPMLRLTRSWWYLAIPVSGLFILIATVFRLFSIKQIK